MASVNELEDIASILRRDCLLMTSAARSGHLSSCLSSAEIMSSLFFHQMQYDTTNALNPDNDEFILSKGHAAPILYSCLKHANCIDLDLLKLRKLDSPLEGHPVPSAIGWIKTATGSLGQGLSTSVGMALAAKLQKRKFRVYTLLGDSEFAEGSNYEALQLASFYKLDNLCAIVDINRLGQRGETMLGHDIKSYQQRFESFGWDCQVVDGHNIKQILLALDKLKKSEKPCAILAKTIKGKGISFIEDKNGWHGKAMEEQDFNKALKNFPEILFPAIQIESPEKVEFKFEIKQFKQNKYNLGEEQATREAYGKALASLGLANKSILALDAEVSNSTFSEEIKKTSSKQFIECFVAEQNMINMAQGLSLKGFNVFCSTFASFLSRAHDQLRMASISSSNFTVCGSHAGISIGEDGPSQMGLEDISMFRSLQNSTIFYPSDSVSTEKIVKLASETKGIKYIRTTRSKTKTLYSNEENFELGDFKVLKQTLQEEKVKSKTKKSKSKKSKMIKEESDQLVLIGSGITLHECLKAYEDLKKKGINSAVIDLYCIKPLNTKKLNEFILKHGSKVIIVEDHYKEGGISELLFSELQNVKIHSLHVERIPHSGTKEQLMEKYNINSRAIVEEAKKIIA